MSKRYTVDETWELCLKMWKDIACKRGDPDRHKSNWLIAHGIVSDYEEGKEADLLNDCFFCQYDEDNGAGSCDQCPAILVNSDFACITSSYGYLSSPRQFYAELKRLNKIRLAK